MGDRLRASVLFGCAAFTPASGFAAGPPDTARFLQADAALAAVALRSGEATSGALSGAQVRRYAFDARAGQFVAVRLAQVRGDLAAVLFDPAGRLVQLADEAQEGGVEVLDAVVQDTGRWTVQVAAFDWSQREAAYEVTLSRRERVERTPAARARQLLAAWYDEDRPGVAIAVVQDDRVLFRFMRGMANLEAGVPIGPRTRFDLASVSKQFTAHAVALLVARGQLSLDERARGIVPELPACAAEVTVRQLLDHRSGLREFDALAALAGAWYADGIDNRTVLDLAARQPALDFAPGTQSAYSNTNYVVLAEIVARRAGVPFDRFMADEVFAPLGMRDALVNTAPDSVLERKANSYSGRLAPRLVSARNIAVVGSTSLNASLDDLVAWVRNRPTGVSGGRQVLDLVVSRTALPDGGRSEYAFGQWYGERDGRATVGHLGLVAGYRISLRQFPAQRLAVAWLANDGADVTWRRAQRIEDLFLGQPDPPPDVPTDQFMPEPTSPPVDPKSLTGLYYADELRLAVELAPDGDRGLALLHPVHGRIALRATPDGEAFTSTRWFLPRLAPIRAPGGAVTGLRADIGGPAGVAFRRLGP